MLSTALPSDEMHTSVYVVIRDIAHLPLVALSYMPSSAFDAEKILSIIQLHVSHDTVTNSH